MAKIKVGNKPREISVEIGDYVVDNDDYNADVYIVTKLTKGTYGLVSLECVVL